MENKSVKQCGCILACNCDIKSLDKGFVFTGLINTGDTFYVDKNGNKHNITKIIEQLNNQQQTWFDIYNSYINECDYYRNNASSFLKFLNNNYIPPIQIQ